MIGGQVCATLYQLSDTLLCLFPCEMHRRRRKSRRLSGSDADTGFIEPQRKRCAVHSETTTADTVFLFQERRNISGTVRCLIPSIDPQAAVSLIPARRQDTIRDGIRQTGSKKRRGGCLCAVCDLFNLFLRGTEQGYLPIVCRCGKRCVDFG